MKWIASLLTVVAAWLFSAWIFMVGVGVIRAEWLPGLPTIGYGPSVVLAALSSLLIGGRAALGWISEALLGGDR